MRSILSTYFVTIIIANRRRLFQVDRNALLLRETLFRYRDEKRYSLHPFVIMPDHIHLLLTPSGDQALERCAQCIKGGFSHAMRMETGYTGQIWQRSSYEHRIRDAEDYRQHCVYIAGNPKTQDYPSLEMAGAVIDGMPIGLSG